MNREFFKAEPDTASLTYILDRYRESGALPAATNDPQLVDLYMRFRLLATRVHSKFDLKDWVTVIWRLQQARISMDTITMRDLVARISASPTPLSSETIVRTTESFASLRLLPLELLFDTLLPAFMEAEKTQGQVIRMLVCLCIFGKFANNSYWRSLLSALHPLQPVSYSDLHKLQMLRFILSTESPQLLLERINSSKETINSVLTPSLALLPADSALPPSKLSASQVSPLHEEVKYVLQLYGGGKGGGGGSAYVENYNVGNGFLVDFADHRTKTCIDVDATFHFYRPTLGRSFLELENKLLNGFTVMKYRTLGKAGWRVVQVPFYEWEEFGDEKEKKIYLSRKLNSRTPLSLPQLLQLR